MERKKYFPNISVDTNSGEELKHRGFTLIEVVVAMGILTLVLTMAVGAFVSAMNTRAITLSVKDANQKVRISYEMITRLSRLAEKVTVDNSDSDYSRLELHFNVFTEASKSSATRFTIDYTTMKLFYQECPSYDIPRKSCLSWSSGIRYLIGDTATNGFRLVSTLDTPASRQAENKFEKRGTYPPILSVRLKAGLPSTNTFYNESTIINQEVILESIR